MGGPTDSALQELKDKVALLEARISSVAVPIAGHTFLSLKDTIPWVILNLPGQRYGLFLDVVSLLERVSSPFLSFQDSVTDYFYAARGGFHETAEAKVAASFKLEVPTIFGGLRDGQESSFPLPSMATFKQWNAYDGTLGVKKSAEDSLEDQVAAI